MALVSAVEEGVGQWFPKGTDHDKPVRVRVHALTKQEEREARRAAYGNRKAGKLAGESQLRASDRGQVYTRECAIRALEDSENLNVELSGPKAVARFRELLGEGVELKDGGEVCLDGRWTPEVKRAYFTEFAFSRSEAVETLEFSTKVGKRDQDEEDETTEGFSQP